MSFRRSNGQLFTGLTSAETFELDGNLALVVAVRDISQLKETQEQLQTSEEKFAKAFHASPDGLLLSRQSDGLLLEVNEGFCRLTGYDLSPTLDQTSLDWASGSTSTNASAWSNSSTAMASCATSRATCAAAMGRFASASSLHGRCQLLAKTAC